MLGNAEKLRPESWRAGRRRPAGLATSWRCARPRASWSPSFDGRARAFCRCSRAATTAAPSASSPIGRGPSRSVPVGAVVAQARALVAAGYQRDRADRRRHHRLRRRPARDADARPAGPAPAGAGAGAAAPAPVLARPGRDRRRHLARCSAEEPRLMPHLHLSLQAGDDLILKRMKRRHSRADALRRSRGARAAARHRVRRRPDRRLPDRDRGDVRARPRSGRPMRTCLPARVSLQPAARHAGGADAAGRAAARERAARLRAAARRAGGFSQPSSGRRVPC